MKASGTECSRPFVERRAPFAVGLVLLLLPACADFGAFVRRESPGREVTAPVGTTTGRLNLRRGPGMGHRVLTTLPRGTKVVVVEQKGIWRRVEIAEHGKATTGWVSGKYLEMSREPERRIASTKPPPREPGGRVPIEVDTRPDRESKSARAPTDVAAKRESAGASGKSSQPTERGEAAEPKAEPEEPIVAALPITRPTPSLEPGPSLVEATGYAAALEPVRATLSRGRLADAEAQLARVDPNAGNPSRARGSRQPSVLALLERGTIELDRGQLDRATVSFAEAETLLVRATSEPASRSSGPGVFGRIFSRGADDEANDSGFAGEGFERVWALDYQALALLMSGDPAVLDVARRAIAAQEEESRKHAESIASATRELASAREGADETAARAVATSLDREYARSTARAEHLPSAFANPFAHYAAAVVEELAARKDPKLRESARAHYAKALEMNPGNELFREAVADLSDEVEPGDDRLVHVLVAEGFAPAKSVLRYDLAAGNESIDVRLPIYSPVPSGFAAAALAVGPTEPPVTLSEIVNVEAASFRTERDAAPKRELAVLRALEDGTDMPEPDTRSWMMLPARFHAARLRLPKGAIELALVTVDDKNEKLGGTTVLLDPEADALIFVRSAGRILAVHATSPDWFREPTATASADTGDVAAGTLPATSRPVDAAD